MMIMIIMIILYLETEDYYEKIKDDYYDIIKNLKD